MSLAENAAKGPASTRGAKGGNPAPHEAAAAYDIPKPRVTEDAAGVDLSLDATPVEITDWDGLLRFFGYDPEHFEVVEDTASVSKWQQSKGYEDGTRDTIWLYSYKARFQRKSQAALDALRDLGSAEEWIKTWKVKPLTRKTLGIGLGEPVAYCHVQGDEQAGKDSLPGIEALAQREADATERSLHHAQRLMARGVNIVEVVDVATGDRIENIFGHYPSQARTASTLRTQLRYARNGDLARTRAFAALDLPMTKVYTPSNHGEIRQVIGQSPYTSASDNYDLIIAEAAMDALGGRDVTRGEDVPGALADQLTWHIPHDDYLTCLTVNDVSIGVSHGHKVTGKTDKWVKDQRDDRNFHDGFRMRVLFMGHKHHFYAEDVGGTTVIQTPSLDGGSPWYQAAAGIRNPPGLLAVLVGAHYTNGWGEIAAF
jgi:hypothetical protein